MMRETSLERAKRALAKRVRAGRADLELTQEEMAQRIGIGPRHYQKIEAAEINPTLKTLIAIGHALGIPVRDLF